MWLCPQCTNHPKLETTKHALIFVAAAARFLVNANHGRKEVQDFTARAKFARFRAFVFGPNAVAHVNAPCDLPAVNLAVGDALARACRREFKN